MRTGVNAVRRPFVSIVYLLLFSEREFTSSLPLLSSRKRFSNQISSWRHDARIEMRRCPTSAFPMEERVMMSLPTEFDAEAHVNH